MSYVGNFAAVCWKLQLSALPHFLTHDAAEDQD